MVTSGALVSGAASVAGLALATRAVGADRVGPLAVAWALAVVVGPGLWSSVEQEAARATARGRSTSAMAWLVVRRAVVATLAVGAAGLAARHLVFAGGVAVPLALAAIAGSYGPLHLAWGRLAGERRSTALATSIAVEGVARLVLVGGTAVIADDVGAAAGALAAAIAVAALVGMLIAGTTPGAGPRPAPTDGDGGGAGRIRSLTWAGLLSQGLFLASPATFEALTPAGDPRTARLAMALVLARAPALAWKGVLTAVIPAVATDRAGDLDAPAAVGRAVLAGSAIAAVGGAAAALALGDRVLDVLTGPGTHLGPAALVLLALATAAYLGALTATAALAGAGRARAAAAAWLGGAATAVAVVMIPGDSLRRVVSALVAGTIVALAITVRACVRPPTRRSGRSGDRGAS
jgi:O-antigen/teichoic acid export membrane protein